MSILKTDRNILEAEEVFLASTMMLDFDQPSQIIRFSLFSHNQM
jgi:hypothetical protein